MLRNNQAATPAVPRQTRINRYLPLVVVWQIAVVVGAALVLQRQWWAYALAGLVVLVAVLVSIPVNGRTLPSTLRLWLQFRRRAAEWRTEPDQVVDLVPLAQWIPQLEVTRIKDAHDGDIGVVADGAAWTAVLGIAADQTLFTDRGAQLDLADLAALMRQDDVLFAGVQVVTLTVPAPSGAMLPAESPALEAYREIAGDAPPPALRRTWIALRLDPRLCLEAVGRRGSGPAGVFATLRFGLHRAQALLKRHGMVTTPLDPLLMAEVLALTSGASPEPSEPRSREAWDAWHCDFLVHETRTVRGFGDNINADYQGLLDVVAQAPVMSAVTSLTMSPGHPPVGAVRLVTPSAEQAADADGYLQAAVRGLRMGPLGGVQVPGVLATVPLGRRIEP